ncbi:MAG: acyl-CoA dehydrogenase family protein [Deltaproteobacteria bacterium]|nr:acyl-CoA dehydrogenase family protein [Deltaproteobacteria bacterium]
MNYDLSDEQRMVQETAYKFATKEFPPLSEECDREEKYPLPLWKKAAEAGLVAAFIPEEYGGSGFGFFGFALVVEQLCRVDMGLGFCVMSGFGSENIVMFGTEEQKQKYLPLVASGQAMFAGAYTEAGSGTDLVGARTTAVKDGDEYVINGTKMFITNGTICDYYVVFCVTNPTAEKAHNKHSLIIVEANKPGITKNKIHGKMGIRASDTAEIAFEDVRVPCENLIGTEGKAFNQLMHFFDTTRTFVSAQALGLSQGALDLALQYVKERTVMGKPLNKYQGVEFILAEMATRVEMMRLGTYKAAWQVDHGQMDAKFNAMVKYFTAENAVWVCDKALQLHGGYGYIDEYPVQRFYRDAKVLEIYEGAKEAEKITIARRL